jgi:hypothetical protein
MKEFVSLGIQFIELDGGAVDMETPSGIFLSRIKAAAAEHLRNQNRWSSLQGHKHRRSQKLALVPCFGYKLMDGQYVVNDDLLPLVQELVETFIQTESVAKTIRILCDKYGTPKRGATRWDDFPRDHKALRYWLENPTIRGTLVYHPKKYPNKPQQEPIEYPGNHQPLITQDQYQSIFQIFKRTKKGRKADPELNPLAGLTFCAGCGSPVRTRRSGATPDKYHYYLVCMGAHPKAGKPQICDRRSSYGLEAQDVEDVVIKVMQRSAERLAVESRPLKKRLIDSPEIVDLKTKIAQLKALNDPDFDKVIAIKQSRLNTLLAEKTANFTPPDQVIDRMKLAISSKNFWKSANPEKRKATYQVLVESVILDKGNVTVKLLA